MNCSQKHPQTKLKTLRNLPQIMRVFTVLNWHKKKTNMTLVFPENLVAGGRFELPTFGL